MHPDKAYKYTWFYSQILFVNFIIDFSHNNYFTRYIPKYIYFFVIEGISLIFFYICMGYISLK